MSHEDIIFKKDRRICSYTDNSWHIRIYSGNATEKLICWTFVLAAVTTTGIIVYGFITKYHKYEVYHSISSTPTGKPFYLQITFCLLAFNPK